MSSTTTATDRRALAPPGRRTLTLLAILSLLMATLVASSSSALADEPPLAVSVSGPIDTDTGLITIEEGEATDLTVTVTWERDATDQIALQFNPTGVCEDELDLSAGFVRLTEEEFEDAFDDGAITCSATDAHFPDATVNDLFDDRTPEFSASEILQIDVETFDDDSADTLNSAVVFEEIVIALETTTDQFRFFGDVTFSNGDPVANALVLGGVATSSSGGGFWPGEMDTFTDAEGAYDLIVPLTYPTRVSIGDVNGSVFVTSNDPTPGFIGDGEVFQDLTPGDIELDFEVVAAASVQATIVDTETGDAPDACVQMYQYRDGVRTSSSAKAVDGEVSLILAEGDSLLEFASCSSFSVEEREEFAADFIWQPQFFDAAATIEDAEPVVIGPGSGTVDLGEILLSAGEVDDTEDSVDESEESEQPTIVESGPSDEQTVSAGGTVDYDLCCFAGSSEVSITLFSDPVSLGTIVADADGRVAGTLEIPEDTTPGPHRLEFAGVDANGDPLVLVIALEVEADDDEGAEDVTDGTDEDEPETVEVERDETQELAATGFDEGSLLGTGLLAIALGMGSLLLTRRRMSST